VNAKHRWPVGPGVWLLLSGGLILAAILVCAAGWQLYTIAAQKYTLAARVYTIAALSGARSRGVFATPQQGVIFNAKREYCGIEKIEIEQAATNSFDGSDPHVWFVLYTVYAKKHAPCAPGHPGPALVHQTYERGGVFYLNVRDGWVMMPEDLSPEFIGSWMKKLGLAGPGDQTHVPREANGSMPFFFVFP
jgi:hypothetical protein